MLLKAEMLLKLIVQRRIQIFKVLLIRFKFE